MFKGDSLYSMSADAGILPDLPDFPGKARNLGLLCEKGQGF